MPNIKSEGITVYYIDLNKPENREMRAKTIAFNMKYWRTKVTPDQRINMKVHYRFKDLFLQLHLVNTVFFETPFYNFKKKKK